MMYCVLVLNYSICVISKGVCVCIYQYLLIIFTIYLKKGKISHTQSNSSFLKKIYFS